VSEQVLRLWQPIENFTLSNITVTMHKGVRGGYQCTGWNGTKTVAGLFATGRQSGVVPPLPARECGFLGPPSDFNAAVSVSPATSCLDIIFFWNIIF
jgi:hypothetical protein